MLRATGGLLVCVCECVWWSLSLPCLHCAGSFSWCVCESVCVGMEARKGTKGHYF